MSDASAAAKPPPVHREPKDKLACSCGSRVFFIGMEGGRAVTINCVTCLLERKLRPT